jgi:hypothetical protein
VKLQRVLYLSAVVSLFMLSATMVAHASQVSGYSFVKTHNIVGSPDGALTDYQVKFIVHSGTGIDDGQDVYLDGLSQSWPDDIRFTNGNDAPLSYWIESYDSSSATVWVKVDDIPAAPGVATVKLYYGKARDAGSSSIADTMIFGDDFNDYKGWSTYYYGSPGSAGVDDGILNIRSGSGGNPATEGVKRSNSFASDHMAWGVKMYASGGEATLYTLTFNPTTDPWHYASWYRLNTTEDHISFDRNTGSYIPQTLTIDDSVNNQAYHVYEIRYNGANVAGYCDGSKVYSEPSFIDGNLYLSLQNCHAVTPKSTYVDYVYIRRYTSSEPIHGSWSEGVKVNPDASHGYLTIPMVPTPPVVPAVSAISPVYSNMSLSGYEFVKAHTINGSPDGALSGYQVKFIVHSGPGTDNGQDVYLNGHSQSWPNDIRFTDSMGGLLDHWVESYDAKAAVVWVKMKGIPASPGAASIHLYYGSPGDAGASNGVATFSYYEDWSSYPAGSNISGQGGWTARRLGGDGPAKVRTDGGVNVLLIGSTTPDNSVITHSFPLYNNQAYRYGAKKLSGSDILQFEACDGTFGTGGEMMNGVGVVYGGYDQAYTTIRKYVNGSESDIARIPDSTGDTSYHIYEWTWSGDDLRALRDGILLTAGSDPTWATGSTIALSIYQSNAYCNYVLVRNYTANEPEHGPWGMETRLPSIQTTTRLSDYSNMKTQTLHGSPDGTLTDYQVKFIIHRGAGKDNGQDVYLNGRSQSWPDDIRFANGKGDVLSYWTESYDSNSAIVWVNVDSIPGSPGTALIKLYYGKPGDESASNGDGTFILFDDFNDGSIDPNKWVKVLGDHTADVYERNGRLELKSGSTPEISRPFLCSENVYDGKYIIDVDARYLGENSIIVATNWDGHLSGKYMGPNRAYESFYDSWVYPGPNYWQVVRDDNGNEPDILGQRDQDLDNGYHHITVIQKPRIVLQVDGKTAINANADTIYTSGYVGLGGREGMNGVQTFYDNFRMSKYTETPPTYGTWAASPGADGRMVTDNTLVTILSIVVLLMILLVLTLILIIVAIFVFKSK